MITLVLYCQLVTNFFKMRPFIKYFQVLRIALMTKSLLPSNVGNLSDFLVKRSILEIVPRFLSNFRFLDQYYQCQPDETLHKAGYGCGVIGNALPLIASLLIFLFLVLLTKLFILDCVKPHITPEQRKRISALRARKREKGFMGELTDEEVKKALPDLVITKSQIKIEFVLDTVGTMRFWFYILDYLKIDLLFITLVALKNTPDVFWNGDTFGKVDIAINLLSLYVLSRFFRWKFATVTRVQELHVMGIDTQTILRSQIKSGAEGIEYMIVKTKEELEKFCDRWSFIV